jgi:FtsZ-interacting cell division protein YlmF
MPENLLKRAKAFIGLEEGLIGEDATRQMELGQTVKRERRQVNSEEGEYEIIIYEPKVYEDSLGISQQLRNGNPVIINLKHLEPNEGTRLIDFVCGTAYAIDGHMIKIAESIFLFTPSHIFISDVEGKSSLEGKFEEEPGGGRFFSRG